VERPELDAIINDKPAQFVGKRIQGLINSLELAAPLRSGFKALRGISLTIMVV